MYVLKFQIICTFTPKTNLPSLALGHAQDMFLSVSPNYCLPSENKSPVKREPSLSLYAYPLTNLPS